MIVGVVTGGRDVTPTPIQLRALEAAMLMYGVEVMRCGGCQGVDRIVYAHLAMLGLTAEQWPADWQRLGDPAGPLRNAAMLHGDATDTACPSPPPSSGTRATVLFAFPGGPGTAGCIRTAKALGIEVVRIS